MLESRIRSLYFLITECAAGVLGDWGYGRPCPGKRPAGLIQRLHPSETVFKLRPVPFRRRLQMKQTNVAFFSSIVKDTPDLFYPRIYCMLEVKHCKCWVVEQRKKRAYARTLAGSQKEILYCYSQHFDLQFYSSSGAIKRIIGITSI